jgi:hypothetical protein
LKSCAVAAAEDRDPYDEGVNEISPVTQMEQVHDHGMCNPRDPGADIPEKQEVQLLQNPVESII